MGYGGTIKLLPASRIHKIIGLVGFISTSWTTVKTFLAILEQEPLGDGDSEVVTNQGVHPSGTSIQ
jgi:hypothetical protein